MAVELSCGRMRCPHPSKDEYPSRETAEVGLRRVIKKYGPSEWLHPYECACGSWHLGHSVSGYKTWHKARERARREVLDRVRPV